MVQGDANAGNAGRGERVEGGRGAQRPKILDVAKACGVSPATVSNALANKRQVKAETRELVRRVAIEMGYRPSAAARGLSSRAGRTWSVGLVVGDIENPVVPTIVRGVEEILWASRTSLILCNTDFQQDKKMAYVRSLVDRDIDGLILVSHLFNDMEARSISLLDLPIVTVNRMADEWKTDYVGIDNTAGTRSAVNYLTGMGHRRIAYIKGLHTSTAAEARFDGYLVGIAAAGGDTDPDLVVQGDYTQESGDIATRQLMALDRPPTAIVAANDLMALGVLGALRNLGVSVPGEVSVVGFDDIHMSRHPLINLTTVHYPQHETGAMAARLLLRRIEDGPDELPRSMVLQPSLIVRGTTAPPRDMPGTAGSGPNITV
ncbi:MAG: LacI family transcriptional regulator [Rhodospirillum sp.]|nr:LacI family transcriptional regulator [Rhodospirillum sp.]MCF8488394.1 LacI family transcriptional regulator [Rhodospirillum sp.]MCF8502320.1 LacI family transcriptional regulator [Rhodospirillum sp.]